MSIPLGRRLWRPAGTHELVLGLVLAIVLPWFAAWMTTDLPVFERFSGLPFLAATVAATLVGRLGAALVATISSGALITYHHLLPSGGLNGLGSGALTLSFFLVLSAVVAYALALKDAAIETEAATRSEIERSARRLSQIQTVTDVALTGLAFDDLAEQLLRKMRQVLDTDSVTLLLLDRAGTALVEHTTVGGETGGSTVPIQVGQGLAGKIASSGSPLVVDDLSTYEVVQAWLSAAMRSFMGVPLVYRGQVKGVIHVATRSSRHFTSDEVEVAELAANRIASALERASLHDSRSAMSEALQRSLMPSSLPEIDGVEIAAVYRPFSPDDQIGGDFYDVYPHGEGTWGAVVGDVSGKGPYAAAIMGLAAHTVRALAAYESRPSAVLAALNDALMRAERVTAERFCTACEMRLRSEVGHLRVTVCLAGHPMPLVMRADGLVEQVGVPGTLLGMFAHPDLHDAAVDLFPGDVLVAYTDGLVERRDIGINAGERALVELLTTSAGLSGNGVANRIERELVDDVTVDDDVAVVVIRKS